MTTPNSYLKLRHLRLVRSIASCGQISIASEQLSITQPAASRTLAEIERLVGEPVFVRHAKGMRLTLIGEVIARHASVVVADLDRIAVEVDAFRRGNTGVVRIGAVTGAAVGFVVPAVQKLKAEAENATVIVQVAPSVDLMEGLLQGEFDIVLSRLPRDMDASPFHIRPGRVEEIRYLVRTGHPLAGRVGLMLDDLKEAEWVIQGAGMPIRQAVEQAFTNRGLQVPQNTIDTTSLLVTLGYLRDTDAVAAISSEVLDLLVPGASSDWATLDLKDSLILSPYQLMHRRDRPLSPICQRLLGLLEAEIAN